MPQTKLDYPNIRNSLGRKTIAQALAEKRNVMHAVILRDIRTRFFNHGLGFLLVPLWPSAHLMALVSLYQVLGHKTIYGDDITIFSAAALVPIMTFMYVTRFMSMSLLSNKPMLAFPVVSILDIVLARAVLEIFGSILAVGIIVIFVLFSSSDPMPYNLLGTFQGLFLIYVFSIGAGIVASVISLAFEAFAMIWAFLMIAVYLLSGALFSLNQFPKQISEALAYNPVIHAVEWIRSCYIPGYPIHYVDLGYLAWWAFGSLFIGLALERILRMYARIG